MVLAISDVSTSSFLPLIQELSATVERQNNALAQRDERINALTRRLEDSENSEFWNMMPPCFKRCYKEIGPYLPRGSTLTYTSQLLTIAGSVYGVAKVVFPDKTVYVCLAIGASPFAFVGLSALIAKVHKVFVQMPSQPNTHPIPMEAPAAPRMGDLRGMNIMPVSPENSEYWNMMPECLKSYWTEFARYLPQESTLRYTITFSAATGAVVAVVSRVFPDRYVIITIGLGAAYLGRERLSCLASRTYGIFSRVLNQLVAVRPIYEENSDAVIEAECATDINISTLIMPSGCSAKKYVDKAILATVEKVNDTIDNLVFATAAPVGIALGYGVASVFVWAGLATASVAMPALTPFTIKMGAGLYAAYFATVVTAVRVSDAFAIHLDSAIQSQQRIMRQDNVPENIICAYTAKAKTHIEYRTGGFAKIVYPSLPTHPVQAITMEPASV